MKLPKIKFIFFVLIIFSIISIPTVIFSKTDYDDDFSILMSDEKFFYHEIMSDADNVETFNVLELYNEKSNILKLFNAKDYSIMYLKSNVALKAGPSYDSPARKEANSKVSKVYLIKEVEDNWCFISSADNVIKNVGYVNLSALYNSAEEAQEASKSKEEKVAEYMHNDIDIYNADGSVNDSKIIELQKSLENEYNLVCASSDLTYSSPTYASYKDKMKVKDNKLMPGETDYAKATSGVRSILGCEVYQCPWWARARAAKYLKEFGTIIKKWPSGSANGGQHLKVFGKYFEVGNEPRENSLAVYSGSSYGHVAYVEAIDKVNKYYYISHSGGGKRWFGIDKVKFGSAPWSNYKLLGFLYLDSPKK